MTDDPAPDFTPTIDVEYEDASGAIVTGPAVVDEEGLSDGTNPGSNAEQASGSLIISSPDGVSAIQIQDVNGNWIDVTTWWRGAGPVRRSRGECRRQLDLHPDRQHPESR